MGSREGVAVSGLVDELNAEYLAKATREGFLDLGDASEALAETRDYELRGWLRDFIVRHDTASALDDCRFGPPGSDAEVMARALLLIAKNPGYSAAIAIKALGDTQAVRS